MKIHIYILFYFSTVLGFCQEVETEKPWSIGIDFLSAFNKTIDISSTYQLGEYSHLFGNVGYLIHASTPKIKNSTDNKISGLFLKTGFKFQSNERRFNSLFIPALFISWPRHQAVSDIPSYYGSFKTPIDTLDWVIGLSLSLGTTFEIFPHLSGEIAYIPSILQYKQHLFIEDNYPIPGIGNALFNIKPDQTFAIFLRGQIVLRYSF